LERFEACARTSQRAHVSVVTLSTAGTVVTEAIAGLGTVAVVLLGAHAVLERDLTLGELLVFVAYLHALCWPITQVASSGLVIQRSGASIERVIQILDQEDEHARGARGRLETVAGRLCYQNVSYGYDEARLAVRDVSLDIAPGEVVAFVGCSGAGKTTLLSL